MESSSKYMYVSEAYFPNKASPTKNRISARFCPKSTEFGKPSKSRPFDPACNSARCGSNPSSGTLFGLFFHFPIIILQHCTLCDKITENRQIRELARARARPRQILPAILLAKYRRIDRARIAGKIGANYRDVG